MTLRSEKEQLITVKKDGFGERREERGEGRVHSQWEEMWNERGNGGRNVECIWNYLLGLSIIMINVNTCCHNNEREMKVGGNKGKIKGGTSWSSGPTFILRWINNYTFLNILFFRKYLDIYSTYYTTIGKSGLRNQSRILFETVNEYSNSNFIAKINGQLTLCKAHTL